MQGRRALALTGTAAALVLLGTPAWADETPSPGPTEVVVDDGGMVTGPGDDPSCTYVPAASGEPTAEPTDDVTAEPTDAATDEPTEEPTVDPTDEPTDLPTDEPTDTPTDEPTDVPTDTPTDEPTGEPTGGPDPGGYYVCASAGQEGGFGSGEPSLGGATVQLPFSGAPVGRYALSGLGLVAAGAGIVLVARRRTA